MADTERNPYEGTGLRGDASLAHAWSRGYTAGKGGKDVTSYRIIRFYKGGRRKTVKVVSSLEIAKLHCNDPRTSKPGVWFDGFQAVN